MRIRLAEKETGGCGCQPSCPHLKILKLAIVFVVPKTLLRATRLAGAVLALTLVAACAELGSSHEEDGGRPVVLTTFTVTADMARNVGGEHIVVESIINPGVEVHGYEPTPKDIAKASRADLIFDNGLSLEAWFEKFVAQSDAPHTVLTSGIEPIAIAGRFGESKPNPHAWMSPLNAQTYVDNIAAALTDLMPEHQQDFESQAATYKSQIQAVYDQLLADLASIPAEQRALVTCEGAFSYLARDANLTEKYIWPVNAEQQATPQQVTSVIEFVHRSKVDAVFCESTVSDKTMQQIVAETGTHFGGVLYVDSLSSSDGPVPTYLDLLRHDADIIVAGLTAKTR